jgi:hypothetical protein
VDPETCPGLGSTVDRHALATEARDNSTPIVSRGNLHLITTIDNTPLQKTMSQLGCCSNFLNYYRITNLLYNHCAYTRSAVEGSDTLGMSFY